LATNLKKKSYYKPFVPAVEHALKVLLCLGNGDKFEKTLTEIYKQVGINKSKAFTILNTLIKFGFVEKNPQVKTYTLGPSLLFLSRYFLDNLNYAKIASPFIENLARETNVTALFGMISGDYLFIIDKYEGNEKIGLTIHLGRRFDITLGAHGKSIVAFMPRDKREKILARKKLYFYGENSLLDMNRLKNELEECRQKGYATDIGQLILGINFISAPVFGIDSEVMGCVVLVGIFDKTLIESYGKKTVETCRQISYKFGAALEDNDTDKAEL